MGVRNEENVGIAFSLVLAAGAATGIGGSVVFFPSLVKLASRKTLAGVVGLSAGVMTYVSFAEIFHESQTSFEDAGFTPDDAKIYSTLCFFTGVVFMVLLDAVVTHLLPGGRGDPQRPVEARLQNVTTDQDDDDDKSSGVSGHSKAIALFPCLDENPIRTLEMVQGMAESMIQHPGHAQPRHAMHCGPAGENPHHHQHHEKKEAVSEQTPSEPPPLIPYIKGGSAGSTAEDAIDADVANMEDQTRVIERSVGGDNPRRSSNDNGTVNGVTGGISQPVSKRSPSCCKPPSQTSGEEAPVVPMEEGDVDGVLSDEDEYERNNTEDTEHNKSLLRMSFNTGLAIALHNFPEGLATFVASLQDPKIGAVLALAIAIHNIPEGLCVSMPIYYATGKKWKAFSWALLSGMTEPIAALLGWLVLEQFFSYQIFALLFGMTSGMMVVVSIQELLPTAHRYDPGDSIVTYCFIAGMAVMALSLILFIM